MKKFNLATKISIGFGLVLFLLVLVSLVSWRGLDGITKGLVEYRGLARDTNLAGRLQANMLMVRMNVKDYLITGSDKDLKQYDHYLQKMNAFLEEAQREIQAPKRAQKVDLVEEDIAVYKQAFVEVQQIRKHRNEIVYSVLGTTGPDMEKKLTSLMASAREDDDVDASYEAGIALRHLLLARLYGTKFLDTNKPADVDRVQVEFSELFKRLDLLDTLLQNPTRRVLREKVQQGAKQYLEAFEELCTIIYQRNDIIAGTLDRIGPEVAGAVEDVKLSVKAEQDILGPILQVKSKNAIRLTLLVSFVAILIGIVFAFFLTRSITRPVQKVVDFVEKISQGDFTSSLVVNQGDEIGQMSAGLSKTVTALGQMIKDIIRSVNTLSTSSTELTELSADLLSTSSGAAKQADVVASTSGEISESMNSVSASMEESAGNVRTVASAVEEMSVTVNEISQNAEKAKNISEEAVEKSAETAGKVNDLGTAAGRIGKVTEVITEISEQTNLLALNATIEAARAGEAGKGFAVVANEIKELAKQTAEATVDIKIQIEGMQTTTNATIDDIQSISEVITQINEVIATITIAVEQQSYATEEISKNIGQASVGINDVNENVAQSSEAIKGVTQEISDISRGSVGINDASKQVDQRAEKLSDLAEQLTVLTKRFKVS